MEKKQEDEFREKQEKQLKDSFQKVLNTHGFGFQYAVIEAAGNLYRCQKSAWFFEVTEFPVSVQGESTHIDFILNRRQLDAPHNGKSCLLIAECKRVNPALSNWCFVRAPYTKSTGLSNCLILEGINESEGATINRFFSSTRIIPTSTNNFFHIDFEIRSNETGESFSKGRGAIKEAIAQVLRGLNGFIEFSKNNYFWLSKSKNTYFLPVIFTTAELWTSDCDLSLASLEKGNIDFSSADLTPRPWIYFQYNQSPSLKHSFLKPSGSFDLSTVMENEFTRTIAIVNQSGIEDFLTQSSYMILP